MTIIRTLSDQDVVFRGFVTWALILLLKTMLMSFLTSTQRFRKNAFENPEDAARPGAEIKKDETVERVRRAHLNDLENIIPFVIIGYFYVYTNPDPTTALILFRIVGVARIMHTIVYAVYPVRQPARAIAFFVALIITLYMLFATIVHFFQI